MSNKKKKILDDVGYEEPKEEVTTKVSEADKQKELKKNKIKSMTFCRRADKW